MLLQFALEFVLPARLWPVHSVTWRTALGSLKEIHDDDHDPASAGVFEREISENARTPELVSFGER